MRPSRVVRFTFLGLCLACPAPGAAAQAAHTDLVLRAERASTAISIDGRLDEDGSQKAPAAPA